jgi:hypothetical protein
MGWERVREEPDGFPVAVRVRHADVDVVVDDDVAFVVVLPEDATRLLLWFDGVSGALRRIPLPDENDDGILVGSNGGNATGRRWSLVANANDDGDGIGIAAAIDWNECSTPFDVVDVADDVDDDNDAGDDAGRRIDAGMWDNNVMLLVTVGVKGVNGLDDEVADDGDWESGWGGGDGVGDTDDDIIGIVNGGNDAWEWRPPDDDNDGHGVDDKLKFGGADMVASIIDGAAAGAANTVTIGDVDKNAETDRFVSVCDRVWSLSSPSSPSSHSLSEWMDSNCGCAFLLMLLAALVSWGSAGDAIARPPEPVGTVPIEANRLRKRSIYTIPYTWL